MSAKGRRYYENFIETQSGTIRDQQVLIVEQKAKITSLENQILAHRCSIPQMFKQLFGIGTKH